MKNEELNRAILVLESPWEKDDRGAKQISILPFIQGVAKQAGNVEVFYANFYDKASFVKALEYLCQFKFDNTTVYIAGHGSKTAIAGVKVDDLLFEIGHLSLRYNITGILLGSCLAATDTDTLMHWTKETNIKWCAGYTTKVNWLEGTLIDCAILGGMSQLTKAGFSTEDSIIESLGQAIAPFSLSFGVGEGNRGKATRLVDGMEFVIRPGRQGCQPKVVTRAVFKEWRTSQLPSKDLVES
jgi:hypothetical protein